MFRTILAVAALALCAACDQRTLAHDPDEASLAGTGLSQAEAAALIQQAPGTSAETYPEGCDAIVNETMMPGDQALLYRAARCDGRTTTLAFAGGAHQAEISIATSALYEGPTDDPVVIRIFTTDPEPQWALREQIAALPAAERATCQIRPAGIEGWPSDALVIAPAAAARAAMPQDEPIQACGPLGLDEDSIRYWRVFQGYAWFFQMGQESQGFDAASVTLIEKQPDGSWRAAS